MTAKDERWIRRILVALDASRASLDALSAAAALAARTGADIEGLFVEDMNLLRAAGLPCASQLALPSGARRPLVRGDTEIEFRALAATARDALAAAANALHIGWSFRVARGQVSVELLHAAGEADVLVLGRTGYRARAQPGTTARDAAARATTPVLIVGRAGALGPPVVVISDGTPTDERSVEVAARLAGDDPSALTVLVFAKTREQAEQFAKQARQLKGVRSATARFVLAARRHDLALEASAPGALLVMCSECSALGRGGLERLLEELDTPVLIVR
ncbi:MAG TPA: universal stress protein [Anaeromyxobacteraceae bacterium]|nr:universal stress protein [Anaeromyxobacteraceae bacterium]